MQLVTTFYDHDAIILSFVVYNAFIYSPKSRHKQQILMLKSSIEVKLQL